MKRVIIFTLAFLCLSVCSCEKTNSPQNSPQNQLVGDWDVILKTKTYVEVAGETAESTYEDDGWIYSFYENGGGRRLREGSYSSFTYQYDKDSNTITFTTNVDSNDWSIDVLTETSFTFNTTTATNLGSIISARGESTLVGKKVVSYTKEGINSLDGKWYAHYEYFTDYPEGTKVFTNGEYIIIDGNSVTLYDGDFFDGTPLYFSYENGKVTIGAFVWNVNVATKNKVEIQSGNQVRGFRR